MEKKQKERSLIKTSPLDKNEDNNSRAILQNAQSESQLNFPSPNKILKATRCKDIFENLDYENVKDEESIKSINILSPNYTTIITNINNDINKNSKKNSEDPKDYINYPFFRIQDTCKYIPQLNEPSIILNNKQLRELHANLPYYQQYKSLNLIYSISIHGTLMRTFYEKTSVVDNSIILIKDDNQNIFGAYSSEKFKIKYNQFYGTSETFLFTFYNENRIHFFPASGINENFIYSDDQRLAFGCSDKAFSLSLENDFLQGYTNFTQTYNNMPLSKKEKFIVVSLEVWKIA